LELETMSAAKPVETSRPDGAVHVLCAHIISTMGKGEVVTDDDMDWPRNWRDHEASKSATVGHQEGGRTVCLHSLAVSPKLQGCGLGKLAMMSYLQIINDSGVADKVALICKEVSTHSFPSNSIEYHSYDPEFLMTLHSILSTITRGSDSSISARARPSLAGAGGMIW
jgi:hypothetical protein